MPLIQARPVDEVGDWVQPISPRGGRFDRIQPTTATEDRRGPYAISYRQTEFFQQELSSCGAGVVSGAASCRAPDIYNTDASLHEGGAG